MQWQYNRLHGFGAAERGKHCSECASSAILEATTLNATVQHCPEQRRLC